MASNSPHALPPLHQHRASPLNSPNAVITNGSGKKENSPPHPFHSHQSSLTSYPLPIGTQSTYNRIGGSLGEEKTPTMGRSASVGYNTLPGSPPNHSSAFLPSPSYIPSLPAQDEKEVIFSNMNDRTRQLLDLLQLSPPTLTPITKPARDPDHPPSPKPLFGTRPPPAALAMQRGFSVGNRTEANADRPISPGGPSGAPQLYASASYESSFAPIRQKKEGPLCSGWLSMQKNAGKWKRYWCEYADGILSYRFDDTTKKPTGTIQVTYCEAELTQLPSYQLSPLRKPPTSSSTTANTDQMDNQMSAITDGLAQVNLQRSSTTPLHPSSSFGSLPSIHSPSTAIGPIGPYSSAFTPAPLLAAAQAPMNKYDEMYWRYLEDEQAFWCFKVISNSRVFLFKTDNPGSADALKAQSSSPNPAAQICGEELRNLFVTTIRTHLQMAFTLGIPSTSSSMTNVPTLPQLNFTSIALTAGGSPRDSPRAANDPRRTPSPTSMAATLGLGNSQIFKQKTDAMYEISPLLHEQFMKQTERFRQLAQAIAKNGFQEDELPITSVRKEKSGVLAMEQQNGTGGPTAQSTQPSSSSTAASSSSSSSSSSSTDDATKWRDYYFVLFEGALFYYKDSKSTTPTGFISLRFASLVVDPKRLMRQEYVFHVVTPLRTVCCKTKHPVALSEWISVLQKALIDCNSGGSSIGGNFTFNGSIQQSVFGGPGGPGSYPIRSNSMQLSPANNVSTPIKMNGKSNELTTPNSGTLAGTPGSDHKSSLAVLQNINKWINLEQSSIDSFQTLIQHPMGLEHFRKALKDDESGDTNQTKVGTSHAHLDFYLSVVEYCNLLSSPTPPSLAEISLFATQIFTRFLTPPQTPQGSPDFLSETSEDQRGIIEDQLSNPTITLFDTVKAISVSILAAEFAEFKRSPDYSALNDMLNKNVVEDKREIDQFEITSSQQFLMKVKGAKRSKEIKFDKKKNVHTIGRDKSNMLVIEDSRVSRSHARVEYSDTRQMNKCEYIDLGSSCGSKLNGKPVLRAKLRPGDVIELGQSVLIFQVKKKKTMKENIKELIFK